VPRQSKLYTPLTVGYVTEVTPLTYPEGATSDELNSFVTTRKSRVPRFGFREEDDFTSTDLGQEPDVTSNHYWDNPGNEKRTRFLVLQVRNVVWFWDISSYNCSGNRKSFTINLNSYTNPYYGAASGDPIDVASGKGYLFITSPRIEPLLVEYDPAEDDITVTQLTLKIRDFKFLPTTEEFTDKPTNPSDEFLYNLYNQGWNDDTLEDYREGGGPYLQQFDGYNRYPSLTKHWGLGLRPYVSTQSSPSAGELSRIGREFFDPVLYERFKWTGTSVAPNGSKIYDAFRITREVDGRPVQQEIKNRRPISVAFKFGRVWWTDGDLIYFSQIIEQDPLKAQNCYQDADPTSNDISEIVDTDGGTINILEAGTVIKILSASNSIIVFTENGVWEISGAEGDPFKPTSYVPAKISNSELESIKTAVDVDGIPMWASTEGLYTLTLDDVSRKYVEQPLTDQTIKTYYDNITDKANMDIEYDRSSKKVYFQHGLNVLVFDTINGSFHPWTIADVGKTLIGCFSTKARGRIENNDLVQANGEQVVANGENVVVTTFSDAENITTIKFIILDDTEVTFGSFIDTTYYDFTDQAYSVYFESGHLFEQTPTQRKDIPMITFYFKEDSLDSECLFSTKWDFADDANSNLWTDPIDIYETKGIYRGTTSTSRQIYGSGNFVVLRFEGVAGKYFELYGFNIDWDINSQTKHRG